MAGCIVCGRVPRPLVRQGDFDAAERAYNSALTHEPRNTGALKEKTQVVAIRSLFLRAKTALERVRGVGSPPRPAPPCPAPPPLPARVLCCRGSRIIRYRASPPLSLPGSLSAKRSVLVWARCQRVCRLPFLPLPPLPCALALCGVPCSGSTLWRCG